MFAAETDFRSLRLLRWKISILMALARCLCYITEWSAFHVRALKMFSLEPENKQLNRHNTCIWYIVSPLFGSIHRHEWMWMRVNDEYKAWAWLVLWADECSIFCARTCNHCFYDKLLKVTSPIKTFHACEKNKREPCWSSNEYYIYINTWLCTAICVVQLVHVLKTSNWRKQRKENA